MIYFIGKSPNLLFQSPISSASLEDLLEYFKDAEEIGFDIETEGFDPYSNRIISYQLGDEHNQFVVDAFTYPVHLVKSLLETKLLIMHNASFDMSFLYHYRVIPIKVWDTYLGEAVIYKGDDSVRKALDFTAYRYLKVDLNKEIRGVIHKEGLTERVIIYAAEDVKYLIPIRRKQIKSLTKKDLMKSMDLENEFVKVITYLKYVGIKLDKNKWITKCEQDVILFNKKRDILDNWIIKNNLYNYIDTQQCLFEEMKGREVNINWASSKQVIKLFKELGINVVTSEGKESVEEKFIKSQAKKFEIISLYLDYKKQEKLLSTYGLNVLNSINQISGRIHSSFTQVMKTGRISSGDKKNNKFSVNLQNIPALPDEKYKIPGKIYERECFTCEDGSIFIDADYSGQEQIVFANMTMESNLINFYKQKLGDMHSFIAAKIYPEISDLPLKEIKDKHADKRQIAKSAGFAINYGGNGYTIAQNLNISQEEGDAIYDAYFKAFPGISAYFKKMSDFALTNGYILFNNIIRSKRFLPEHIEYKRLNTRVSKPGFWYWYSVEKNKDSRVFKEQLQPLVRKKAKIESEIKRLALNSPIQGTSAEITKIAAIYFFNYLIENKLLFKVFIVNLIHDEILIEAPKNLAEELAKVLKLCMERAGDIFCKTIKLEASPVITEYWVH